MRYLIVLLTILVYNTSIGSVDYYDIKDSANLNVYLHYDTKSFLNDEKMALFKQLVYKSDTLFRGEKVNLIYMKNFTGDGENHLDVYIGEQTVLFESYNWTDTISSNGIWIIYYDANFDLNRVKNAYFNIHKYYEKIKNSSTKNNRDTLNFGSRLIYKKAEIDINLLKENYPIKVKLKEYIYGATHIIYNGSTFKIRYRYKEKGLEASNIHEYLTSVSNLEILFVDESTFYLYGMDDVQRGPFKLDSIYERAPFSHSNFLGFLDKPDRLIFRVFNHSTYSFTSAFVLDREIMVHDIHKYDSIYFESFLDGRFEERIVNYQEPKEEPLFGLKEILYLIIGVVVGTGAILILKRKK